MLAGWTSRHGRSGLPRSLGAFVLGSATALALVTVMTTGAQAPWGAPAGAAPESAQAPYAGYLFTYFTGEGTANGEQVYFALSQGNDPLRWRELNGGSPVLTSTLGERGVRDPFLIRSPEGDRFFLIGTDLRIYGTATGIAPSGTAARRSWSGSPATW